LKTENLQIVAKIDFAFQSNEKFVCEIFLTQLSSRFVGFVVVFGENVMATAPQCRNEKFLCESFLTQLSS